MSSFSPPKPAMSNRPLSDRERKSTQWGSLPTAHDDSISTRVWPSANRASDIIAVFLLEQTGGDGAALAFPERGTLAYRARAGMAESISPKPLQDLSDWVRRLAPFVAVTDRDLQSAAVGSGQDLASAQCGARSAILVPFLVKGSAGFVEVFSKRADAFGEKEKLLVQLIATVVSRAFPGDDNGTSLTALKERADCAKAAEQIAEKLNTMTRPTIVPRRNIGPLRANSIASDHDAPIAQQSQKLAQVVPMPTRPQRGDTAIPVAAFPAEAGATVESSEPTAPSLSETQAMASPGFSQPTIEQNFPQQGFSEPDSAPASSLYLGAERSSAERMGTHRNPTSIESLKKWAFRTESILAALMILVVLIFGFRLHRGEVSPSGNQSATTSQVEQPPASLALVSSHMSLTDDPLARRMGSTVDVPRLLAASQGGDAKAQFQLGVATEMGNGAQQNCSTAAAWIGKSANQGYAPAEYNLALRYWDGDGVWANRAESVRWLRLAAQDGDGQAKKIVKELPSENQSPRN